MDPITNSTAGSNTNMAASQAMLKKSLDLSEDMVMKLIKLNVEAIININQTETMGNVIDMYV